MRTLKGSTRRGLNRVSWDLRMDPPVTGDDRDAPAGGGFRGAPSGPTVLPGSYTVA